MIAKNSITKSNITYSLLLIKDTEYCNDNKYNTYRYKCKHYLSPMNDSKAMVFTIPTTANTRPNVSDKLSTASAQYAPANISTPHA